MTLSQWPDFFRRCSRPRSAALLCVFYQDSPGVSIGRPARRHSCGSFPCKTGFCIEKRRDSCYPYRKQCAMKRPRLCAGVRRRACPEFYEKGTVRLQMEEKRETAAASVPGGEPNELYTKQIFSDAPVKPSEQSGETAAPAAEAETIAFDKPTVLDESFAARKAAPPAAEPAPPHRGARHSGARFQSTSTAAKPRSRPQGTS